MAGICNEHPWPQNEADNGCGPCRIEVCDICRATPAWVYLSDAFVSEIVGIYPDGRREKYTQYNHPEWAICEACHHLIQANDLDGLAERTMQSDWDGQPERAVRAEMRDLVKADIMKFHRRFIEGVGERAPTRIHPA